MKFLRDFFRRLFFRRSMPVLSEASASDARAIAALHAKAFHRGWSQQEFERLLAERNVLAHRALNGGKLAGFIMSRMAADEAEILSVAVAKENRGRGFAHTLLRLHLGRLAGLGIKTVFLEVDEANKAAIRLYSRQGFERIGQRTGYYAGPKGPANAVMLARVLRRNRS